MTTCFIPESVDRLSRATSVVPLGWLGPKSSEAVRTPQLLPEVGIHYVCDWPNGEQPYRMKTRQGELFALPMAVELDDVNALWYRRFAIDCYAKLLKESFARLCRDGVHNGWV